VIHFPDSPRFHVIDASKVMPRYGRIASRPIYVYLPEMAEHDHRKRFPVLYCHDGQNIWDDPHCCFGHGGWYLNQIADQLTREGKIEPIILVGIPNSDSRVRDYTPGKTYNDILGHPYANFVCDVVKRYVDKHFPTKTDRKHTALMGSSLGGLISLWMAHKLPETFSKAACLSGAFEFKDRSGQSFLDFLRRCGGQDVRVYLDSGTIKDGAPLTRKVRDIYLACGWKLGKNLMHFEEKGGDHSERYWRGRVWQALIFLFGEPSRAK
jgi:enterochelin esterase-like enzyme